MSLPLVPVSGNNILKKLEYLQTLSIVEDFRFTAEAIGMIPNLRKLKIRCTTRSESDGGRELYCLHNQVHLHQLEELKVISLVPLFLPGDLAFPLNLKKLSLDFHGMG